MKLENEPQLPPSERKEDKEYLVMTISRLVKERRDSIESGTLILMKQNILQVLEGCSGPTSRKSACELLVSLSEGRSV